jgi:hypothetical protein
LSLLARGKQPRGRGFRFGKLDVEKGMKKRVGKLSK